MAHKIERITTDTLIVGIDIAKRTHWAQFTDSRGVPLRKPLKVENSFEGFEGLSRQIKELQARHGLVKVMIAFEPSGHYWRTLAWYFKPEDVHLQGVNPYHVKQIKELDDNTQTKSDKKDALVIAHLVRDGRYFDVYMPEEKYAELRILRRHREQLSTARKRMIIFITNILDEYFPEYETIGYHVGTASARAILRAAPFPAYISTLDADELWEKWKEQRTSKGTRLSRKLAGQFVDAAKSSIGITTGLRAASMRLNDLLDQLDILDLQIENCDQAMNDIISALDIEKYLTSVPGVGKIIAASFIAETGDLNRFDDWKQVRKMAGLNLVEQSSGQHKGKTKISKRGRPDLRRIIYIIGDKGMLVSPEMRVYYNYLRHRQTNQLKHQQAILAIGLKLMRIMFHVVKHREYYDPVKALGDERMRQIQSMA